MLKIAVCDDEKAVCDQVSGLLNAHNNRYSVSVFSNGSELLTSESDFDVVILDIEMPELDGMTAADRLRRGNREFNHKSDLFLLYLSPALILGFDGYSKPVVAVGLSFSGIFFIISNFLLVESVFSKNRFKSLYRDSREQSENLLD
jgi:CheY-like chemotaxis protein